MKTPAILSFVVLLAQSSFALAADLLVPSQYSTIQAAVNAAQNGDRVLVAPGTYNEQITIDGKAITVRSSGTASNTKIDRNNAAGDVFTIRNVASGTVTLQGLTVLKTASDAVDIDGATVQLQNFRVLNSSRGLLIGANATVNANDLQCLFLYGGNGAGCLLNAPSSRLSLADSSFQAVTGGNGNCILVSNGAVATATDVLFASNSGGDGCVRIDGSGSFTASSCRWQLGSYSAGSVVYISEAGTALIEGAEFVSQSGRCVHSEAGQVTLRNIEHLSQQGLDYGSFAYANTGNLVVANVTSSNCIGRIGANSGGAWIQVNSAALSVDGCVVTGFTVRMPDYQFSNGRAYGGLIGVFAAGPTVTIQNSTFGPQLLSGPGGQCCYGSIELRGRAVSLRGRDAQLENCTFSGGVRDASYVYVLSEVYVEGRALTVTGSNFDLSTGGRYSIFGDMAGSVTVQGSVFRTGSYDHPTIGVNSTGSLLINLSRFDSCHRAVEQGGSGPVTVSNSWFINNVGSSGSAIASASIPPTVEGCFFKGNTLPSIWLGGGQNFVLLSDSSFCGSPNSEIYRYIIEKGENYFNIGCSDDCDLDGLPDSYELTSGLATDCNANGVPDNCDADSGGADCNGNDIPDSCDIANGAADCNANGILDSCEPDCDADGTPDACEIASGASDCDANGVPDSCQADCDSDGVIDICEIAAGATDCDADGTPDACEIATVPTLDFNNDGTLDSCQPAMQFAGLQLEIQPIVGRGTDDLFPAGAVCYRLYARVTTDGASAVGIYGNSQFPMVLNATGGFWQSPFGGDLSVDVACNDTAALPSYRFDSWFTVGKECALGNATQNTGLDLAAFNAGGGVNDADGIVFVAPGSPQANGGAARRVLLAQLTTTRPVFPTGKVNVVGRSNGGSGPENAWLALGQQIPMPALVDCNGNGEHDAFDIAKGVALDCDQSGVPDTCEHPSAVTDCNGNGISDLCDCFSGFSSDINTNNVPDECECTGDIDANGVVDVDDIIWVLVSWGADGTSEADVNSDGIVNGADLAIVLQGWGQCS